MSASTAAACPFYLKGTCRRGKACELRHGKPRSAKSPSTPPPSTPVCKYFLQKKCVYGDKCKQSHAKSHAKKPPPASKSGASGGTESIKPDPDPPSAQDTPDEQDQSGWGAAPTGWGQDAVDDAGGTPPPQEGEGTTKPACFFFAQGTCGKGDACEFAHTASSPDGSGKDSDAKPPSPSKKKSEPKICKHYVRGSCRAGDACRLKHVQPVDKSSNAAAGSESSESHSDWDANGPSNGTAGISASGGPEAADQHIPFSNGTADAEDEMHWAADPVLDDADDIYGDREEQDVNGDEDEDDTSKNMDDTNQEAEDEDEDNGEADTTLTQHEQAASSGYASSRSTKEPSRRGSWYGSGWDEPPLSSASAPSSVGLPPRAPSRPSLSPAYPQPAPPVTTSHAPAVQPHWSQFADPQADPQIAFCKPHAQALCAQGAACRFRHFLTPEEYTLLFHDPQPNLWTYTSNNVSVAPPPLQQQPVSPVYNIPAVTISQIDITENETSAPPTRPISTFKQECKFYRLGTCRNAELCPYEHTQHPDPVVPSPASARADREWGRPSSRNREGKIDAPCRFFVEKNYCNRGNDCKFRHDRSTDRVDEAGPAWPSDNNNNNEAPAWPSDDNNNDNDDAKKEADNGWGDDGQNDNSGWDNNHGGGGWGATATNADSWGTSWDNAGTMDDFSGQTTSNSQPTRRTNECYQFKEGRCRRGNDCRFSHDLQPNKNSGGDEWPPEEPSAPASEPWVAQSVPCRFFARGNCWKGKDCPDLHDPPENEKPQENGWPSEPDERNVEDGTAEQHQAQPADDPPPQEEPHWTASWAIEDTPAQIAPGSINKPCKMFAQGFCRFGDECSFKHGMNSDAVPTGPGGTLEANSSEQPVSSDYDDDDDQRSSASDYMAASPPIARDAENDPEGQPQPITFDRSVVVASRFWDQCNISYGEDMTPTTVTTLADSKKLILSNLPVEVAPEDIARLTRPHGEIAEIISLDETVHSAVIQVEFEEASQAYEAFKHLDGQEYESNVISATLKATRTVPVKRSVGQKIYIKVSWPKPSKRAWSHYPTINKAKQQAIDLNGVIIRGRAIKASFVSPSKIQKTAFAVFLQNINPETTKSELDAVCTQSDLITIDPPIYSEDATDEVKSTFDELGPTEQFDVLPVTSGATSTAFVTFHSEAVAAEVVGKLKSRPLPFLGKESLTIRDVHYARYCIAKAQFEVIKSEIDNLKEQSDGSNRCTIQYDDHPIGKLVWIRIHASSDNSTQFANMNGELQSIVQGIVVMSDGKEVWDDYFETSNSANAMGRTQTQTDTLVQCDLRAKRIRIFGSKANQVQAQDRIMRGFSKMRDLRKEIDLPRHKLHPLVNGEFKTLQDTIGAHKILLDVFRSKLLMLGSPDEVSKANNVISQMNDGASTASSSRNTCQICQHSAVNPILLSCHHAYCNNCLRFAIRQTRIAPFQCISQHTSRDGENKQCSARVPYAILHDILLAEEDQVLRATWYAYVRSRSHELFFCPSLDCPAVHRVRDEGVNIKCALCVSELCTYCKSLAHIGRPCATRA